MNTKVIAVVVGLAILLGAGGLFLYSQNKNPQSTPSTNSTDTSEESSGAANSLFDLLTSGKNQSCTFSDKNDDGSSTDAAFYLSGKKMRGDITTTSTDGKTTMTYMIRDGDTNYIWGSEMEAGIKMTISEEDLKTNTQANQYVNTTEKVDYKCSSWTVDSSKFSPPTNVEFTDFSSMMPKTTGTTQYQPGAGYSCAGITDPTAKAACEASLQQ